jgi:hypothetical protein
MNLITQFQRLFSKFFIPSFQKYHIIFFLNILLNHSLIQILSFEQNIPNFQYLCFILIILYK